MIIDAHQHVFWHGRDDAGLVADMDEQGIDIAWLLSVIIHPEENYEPVHSVLNPMNLRTDGTHAGIPLRDLVTARDRYPHRFVLGYCPHPQLGDAAGLFEAAHRTFGVRVCGEWEFRMLFDDPRCLNLFRKAGEMSCPVVLHLDVPYLCDNSGNSSFEKRWCGGTVDNLERALIACPETNFIGHAPGFWREISGDSDASPDIYPEGLVTPGGRLHRLFDTYPNLYADISAKSGLGMLRRDLDHASRFINQYSDRLLFGRDHYGGAHQELLNSLGLQKEVLDRLYRENALKLVPSNALKFVPDTELCMTTS